jgi:hypothetical protein
VQRCNSLTNRIDIGHYMPCDVGIISRTGEHLAVRLNKSLDPFHTYAVGLGHQDHPDIWIMRGMHVLCHEAHLQSIGFPEMMTLGF